VSFAKDNRRRFVAGRRRFVLPPLAASPMMRVLVLALAGAVLAAWALLRHYTRELPPVRVPVTPSTAPTYDPDAGEMPVPEITPWDGG